MKAKLVITTYENESEADKIAKIIIEKKLAVCATRFQTKSTYHWKGQVEIADEYLVIFKTLELKTEALKDEILKTHSYKIPEILEIDLNSVNDSYLEWMKENLI